MVIGNMNPDGVVDLKVSFNSISDVCANHGSIMIVPKDYNSLTRVFTDHKLRVDIGDRIVTIGFINGQITNGYLNIYPDLISDMFGYDTCWYKGFQIKFAHKVESIPRRPGMYTRVSDKGRLQVQYYFSINGDVLDVEFTEALGWRVTQEVFNAFNACLSSELLGIMSGGLIVFKSNKMGSVTRWLSKTSSKLAAYRSYECPRYIIDSLSRLSSYSGQIDGILRDLCNLALSDVEDINISFMQFCIEFVKMIELSIYMGDSGLDICALLACQKMRKIAQDKGFTESSEGLKNLLIAQKLAVVSEYLVSGNEELSELLTTIGKMRNMYVHTPLTFANKGLTDSVVRLYMLQCAYIALIFKLHISGIKIESSTGDLIWQRSKFNLYDDLKTNLQSLKADVTGVTWSQELWRGVLYKNL